MSSKHTPGPWGIDPTYEPDGIDEHDEVCIYKGAASVDGMGVRYERLVAVLSCEPIGDPGIGMDEDDERYVIDANARLIAAAPDLLEALEALLEVSACENECAPDDMTCATNAARAAIAKATS